MADVLRMTPLELLQWLGTFDDRGQVRATPSMALACVNIGVTDTDWIAEMSADGGALAAEVGTLGRRGPFTPPLTGPEVDMLGVVGHRVFLEDRDNAADWLLFAKHLDETAEQWKGERRYVGNEYARALIASLLDAGRGPRYGRDILDRAAAAHLLPNTYGWAVDPQEFSDLAAAGVRSATQIAEWQRALGEGYTPTRMLELAAAGVASSVAVAAAERGIPVAEWPDRLAGIPGGWVRASSEGQRYDRPDLADTPIIPAELPKTARGSTLGASWSLDDLRYLADNGWANVALYNLTHVRYGKGRRGGGIPFAAADACYLAANGVTPAIVDRLMSALTEGGYRVEDDGTPPYLDGSAKLTDVVALHQAGVRASHVRTWRWAGCRSTADVLRAVEAGITPTIADELTRKHGGKLGRWGKRPGLRSVEDLLRLHAAEKGTEPATAGPGR